MKTSRVVRRHNKRMARLLPILSSPESGYSGWPTEHQLRNISSNAPAWMSSTSSAIERPRVDMALKVFNG